MSNRIFKLVVAIILIFALIIGIYFYSNNNKTIIMNDKHSINNKSISIMLETDVGTGIYEVSDDDEWPENGYVYNTLRSGCENGSTISFDDVTGNVIIKGNISDKCYVYFDVEPPHINLAIPDCPNAVVSWNRGLQQLVVTSFTTNSLNCTMEEETVNNVTKLSDYIIGLAGTTQGNGKVMQEIGTKPDYSDVTIIKNFGTTPAYFRNTSNTSTTQTQIDDFWTFDSSTGVFTSDPEKMETSGSYYHVYAKVPERGYYQICYTLERASSSGNKLYISKNTTSITNISASTSSQINETCYVLGLLSNTDYINISEYASGGTSSPVITFRLEKGTEVSINTGYRYQGIEPNNYIMFNNELWRIIGVFETEYDANGDGTADNTDNLVKIIRDESIGALQWHGSNSNNWKNASLQKLLNGAYFNHSVDTSNCYMYYSIAITCDYRSIGIKDKYQNMVETVTWYLGGPGKAGYTDTKLIDMYNYERNSETVYNGYPSTYDNKIGIMYASDYLFATLSSDCSRDTLYTNYESSSCSGKNWLFKYMFEKFITPKTSSTSDVMRISVGGSVHSQSVREGYDVRPVLYLSSNVYKISGSGDMLDPYIIDIYQSS